MMPLKNGKKKNPAALSKIRFESLNKGLSAQIMYIGPYFGEGPTVAKLHAFIEEKGYQFNGILVRNTMRYT